MTTTQQFIPIQDIKDDLIFLKDGSVSLILGTSAVNFSLLFETEQISIIQSFAGLLNSLSFPIQIVIHSKRLDVSSYLTILNRAETLQTNPLLKKMILSYRHFVESIIKENNVLDKQFYVCLNVSAVELGILPKSAQDKTRAALTILNPRKDHLIKQLTKLGLKTRQLTTEELIKVYYSFYNNPQTIPQNIPAVPPAPLPPSFTLRRLSPNLTRPTPAAYYPNPRWNQPLASLPQPSTAPLLPSLLRHLFYQSRGLKHHRLS